MGYTHLLLLQLQRSSLYPDGDEWGDHFGWNDSCRFDLPPSNHSQISVPKNPEQGKYMSIYIIPCETVLYIYHILTSNLYYHVF